jgi:proteic killer suppression protein
VGRGYTEPLKKIAEKRGATIRLGTKVNWIYRKDVDGPVLGVEVEKGKRSPPSRSKKVWCSPRADSAGTSRCESHSTPASFPSSWDNGVPPIVLRIVDTVTEDATIGGMIKSFKHKGLAELFEKGNSRKVRQDLQSRSLRSLEALDQAESLTDLNVPGFNFHGLKGVPKRYSIHVNGPWSITFEWEEGDALRIDFEQYH